MFPNGKKIRRLLFIFVLFSLFFLLCLILCQNNILHIRKIKSFYFFVSFFVVPPQTASSKNVTRLEIGRNICREKENHVTFLVRIEHWKNVTEMSLITTSNRFPYTVGVVSQDTGPPTRNHESVSSVSLSPSFSLPCWRRDLEIVLSRSFRVAILLYFYRDVYAPLPRFRHATAKQITQLVSSYAFRTTLELTHFFDFICATQSRTP